MFDRRDAADIETFRIGLVWEQASWTERVLQNLEDDVDDSSQPKTTVDLVRIRGVRSLADEVFQQTGVTEIIDDE
jgi:hypothetical protein